MLSCAGLIALNMHIVFAQRLEHILKSSPVRALRIGCAMLVTASFLLPFRSVLVVVVSMVVVVMVFCCCCTFVFLLLYYCCCG